VVEGDAVVFYASPARGAWLPDYFLDRQYRAEMNRRAQLGGPALKRFPADAVLRRADYDFKLDAPGYRERLNAMFTEYDRNRDGVVTAKEYVDSIP